MLPQSPQACMKRSRTRLISFILGKETLSTARKTLNAIDRLALKACNRDVLIQIADRRGVDLFNIDDRPIDKMTAAEILDLIVNA